MGRAKLDWAGRGFYEGSVMWTAAVDGGQAVPDEPLSSPTRTSRPTATSWACTLICLTP